MSVCVSVASVWVCIFIYMHFVCVCVWVFICFLCVCASVLVCSSVSVCWCPYAFVCVHIQACTLHVLYASVYLVCICTHVYVSCVHVWACFACICVCGFCYHLNVGFNVFGCAFGVHVLMPVYFVCLYDLAFVCPC